MWLCPKCFEECPKDICTTCNNSIVIEGRYTLVHCIKVIPRMCFEGKDLQTDTDIFLYQKSDHSWCVVPSPEDLDIKKTYNELHKIKDTFRDTSKHRKQRNRSLYMTEEPLDPLDPNGVSQFVIQLPQKHGWWSQQQSQSSWKQDSIHPALILVSFAFLFILTSIIILLLLT